MGKVETDGILSVGCMQALTCASFQPARLALGNKRPSPQLAPQFSDTRNVRGAHPTHQRRDSIPSTSETTCRGQGKMHQVLLENCLCRGIPQNKSPQAESIFLSQRASQSNSSLAQQARLQAKALGCVYLWLGFATRVLETWPRKC